MPDYASKGPLSGITDRIVAKELAKLWSIAEVATGQIGNATDRFVRLDELNKVKSDLLARIKQTDIPGFRQDFVGGVSGPAVAGASLGWWIDADPPADPTKYVGWWNNEEGAAKIWYLKGFGDPDSSQWVDIMPARQGLQGDPGTNGTNGTSGGTAAECRGRLTLVSGTPVPTTDQTAKSTLYWTPYNGATIAMYISSTWTIKTYTEVSLSLSGLTADKNYDVWGNDSSGTLVLSLSAAWTNDTTRADAVALQDGIVVKSGDATKRHLGTIRTTGTTTTEDSAAKRFVWNRYNQVKRYMANPTEGTNSWGYTTGSFRQANANTANQLDYVDGDGSAAVEAHCFCLFGSSSSGYVTVGIGVDSTTVNSAQTFGGWCSSAIAAWPQANWRGTPGLGRHYLAWIEKGQGVAGGSFYGDNGATYAQSGIIGSVIM